MRLPCAFVLFSSFLAGQIPEVGIINFYGVRVVPQSRLRETLGVKEGDPLPKSKTDVEEALERGAECWLLLEGPEAAQGWLAGMREIFREAPEAGSSLDLGTPAAVPVHEEAP